MNARWSGSRRCETLRADRWKKFLSCLKVILPALKPMCQLWVEESQVPLMGIWRNRNQSKNVELHLRHKSFVLKIFQEQIDPKHWKVLGRSFYFSAERLLWRPVFNPAPFVKCTKAPLKLTSSCEMPTVLYCQTGDSEIMHFVLIRNFPAMKCNSISLKDTRQVI